MKSLPYDPAKDFTPVAMVVDFAPQMLSVNAELPVKSVPEFMAYAKANPGKLSYAVDVTVTAAQVSARLLKKRAGLDMVEVPYRSPAQMATDVGSGRIQVTVSSLAASGAMIQAGKIRPLGWFGSKRFSYQPDMPTVSETVPGVVVDAWFIIVAPAGTPADTVKRMNQEIAEVSRLPHADCAVAAKQRATGGFRSRRAARAGFDMLLMSSTPSVTRHRSAWLQPNASCRLA